MRQEEYQNISENQATHRWYQGMGEINRSLLNKYLPKKILLRY